MLDSPHDDTAMGGVEQHHQPFVQPNGFINPMDLFHAPPPQPQLPPPPPQPELIPTREEFLQEMEDLPAPEDESEGSDDTKVNERPRRNLPTGCCYDSRMMLHANADFSTEPHHPEDPRRIQAIFSTLHKHGLVFLGDDERLAEILYHSPNRYMRRVPARAATKKEITLVHTHEHFDWVFNTSQMESEALRKYSAVLDAGRTSIYIGNFTHEAAILSVGGAIETCKHIMEDNIKNGIAVIRPPGHHAEAHEAMGFCFFNNVPIAVRTCQNDYPDTCRKVMILDWDVHHGNGTQNIFYDDPNVLYISLHVWMDGVMYPGFPDRPGIADASHTSVGEGRGIGKNVNIPWKTQNMGDGDYMAAFQKIVMPIAQEFEPDLVVVSAGFDAASGDHIGGCHVTPECYSHMTHMLMSLANGRVAVCLEGGYNLQAISRSALAVAQTLMGEPPRPMSLPPISATAVAVLRQVQQAQAPYWECMRPKKVDWKWEAKQGHERMTSIVRAAQYDYFREKHNMLEHIIATSDLAAAFKHQVLMTPKITLAKKIFLAIHGPPGAKVDHEATDKNIDTKNIWLTDPVRPYIDWAVDNGFGIIDIALPEEFCRHEDDPMEDDESKRKRKQNLANTLRETIVYIWDNFLEEHSTDNIVIMGVGEGYGAIKELLTNRSKYPISFHIGKVVASKTSIDGRFLSPFDARHANPEPSRRSILQAHRPPLFHPNLHPLRHPARHALQQIRTRTMVRPTLPHFRSARPQLLHE